ncbi:MAG: hypothetical protein DRJ10_16135 [Bacteroidetes bacterium]|nr:MAG: hypothetical protein DRJ10_16135 [Bacteroidota bacterium]
MDEEVKNFLLKYIEDIDEEVYLNFIAMFSKHPVKFVKKVDMSVYLKCKQFSTENKLKTLIN